MDQLYRDAIYTGAALDSLCFMSWLYSSSNVNNVLDFYLTSPHCYLLQTQNGSRPYLFHPLMKLASRIAVTGCYLSVHSVFIH